MSESVSTGGATATGSTSAAQSTTAAASTSTQSSASGTNNKNTQSTDTSVNAKDTTPVDDGMEEISLGSTKSRVPKEIAKSIKEYERGIQSKFREFSEQKKSFAEKQKMLEMFSNDPKEFFRSQGKNPVEFAEDLLAREYEMMQMNPAERENIMLKQQLAQTQKMQMESKRGVIEEIQSLMGKEAPQNLDQYQKEDLQQYLVQQQEIVMHHQKNLENDFISAWKETGLPKDPFIGAQMAFMMRSSMKTDTPLTAVDAANNIKQKYQTSVRSIIQNMDPQGIQEFIGQDAVEKLRQFAVSQVNAFDQKQNSAQQAVSSQPKKQFHDIQEWRKFVLGN